jgi:chemotaxis protein methyltransferase CheR
VSVVQSDAAVERITGIVAAETGLCFRWTRAETEAGIRRAMTRAQVKDLREFASLLETRQLPIDELVNELTIGESYFFREPQQFDFIRQEVFSDVLARCGPDHKVRIWSAGCASGEEAYSLAITLTDARRDGHVLATDLSRRALERARAATYRRWSLRGLDDALIRRCFHESGNLWTLDPRFRVPVTFEIHNLARGVYPSITAGIWGMDLILCRNVLIYLDPDEIRHVAQRLCETLSEDGWFFTGPSDPPLSDLASLSPVMTPHGVVYRKKTARSGATPLATFSIAAIRVHTSDVSAIAGPGAPPSRHADDTTRQVAGGHVRLADAQAALASGEYDRAIELTRGAADEASAALRIRTFANRDGAELALKELDAIIERFPFSTALHLLRAVLRIDLGYHEEALHSLRHVLYLDRTLIIAHFMLATALRRRGRLHEARRAYRNARDLAIAWRRDEPLPLADGERAATIADASSAELALLDAPQVEPS